MLAPPCCLPDPGPKRGEKHSGIGLVSMSHLVMDAIEIENAPVFLQWTLTPDFKLFGQGLVEVTDTAGARSHSDEGLSHIAYFLGADSCHEHLGKPFSHVWFITQIAVKDLRMELTFSISWDSKIFDGT